MEISTVVVPCFSHHLIPPSSGSRKKRYLSSSNHHPSNFTKQLLHHLNPSSFIFHHFDRHHHRRFAYASSALPPPREADGEGFVVDEEEEEGNSRVRQHEMRDEEDTVLATRVVDVVEGYLPEGSGAVIAACSVGLLTGVGVVLFNNLVHEIREFFWDGIPSRGASWLRGQSLEDTWERTMVVPVCGGFLVSCLNVIRGALEGPASGISFVPLKAVLKPLLKSLAACVTLGTGNSLGPEGPSVEIGSSIAKGVGAVFDRRGERKVSLTAAGSAAGISSGFNAAVAGCFFGVESVLWPSPPDSSGSLTNTTSMVILSAVIASVLSQVGLGSEPAFRVPDYDFRSPSELPLYLLLGIICGLVSLALSRSTSYFVATFERIQKIGGIPGPLSPIFGGVAVGLIALAYPEILYWGFENVDILLESRPFVNGLPANLLLQLVAVKILATSLCRASGLVGGYYAPSLFIGAATGMAYGKFIAMSSAQSQPFVDLSFIEVASPQAYGLVGMAATLAGVCQVPLTSVLLLFELTQDYRIVLPLLGAVGLSSWITSSPTRRMDAGNSKKLDNIYNDSEQIETSALFSAAVLSRNALSLEKSSATDLCEVESSLCLDDCDYKAEVLRRRISVSQAMRTRYVTVGVTTLLIDVVTLMLTEKQSCAFIVDADNVLIGFLLLPDIQQFIMGPKARGRRHQLLSVADMCSLDGEKCHVRGVVTPSTNILSADKMMTRCKMDVLPVVSEHDPDDRGHPVGIIERECIQLACRAVATRESLREISEAT